MTRRKRRRGEISRIATDGRNKRKRLEVEAGGTWTCGGFRYRCWSNEFNSRNFFNNFGDLTGTLLLGFLFFFIFLLFLN
jgi:hypothetical protein